MKSKLPQLALYSLPFAPWSPLRISSLVPYPRVGPFISTLSQIHPPLPFLACIRYDWNDWRVRR